MIHSPSAYDAELSTPKGLGNLTELTIILEVLTTTTTSYLRRNGLLISDIEETRDQKGDPEGSNGLSKETGRNSITSAQKEV